MYDVMVEPTFYAPPSRSVGIPAYVQRGAQDDFQSPSVPQPTPFEHWCSLYPSEPYAFRQEITVEYEEVDEGIDWSAWYYLFVASLARRKVIYEIQRYYKTPLYCDGTEGERELVKEVRQVYDEYNQASLFGLKDVLEWNSITVSVSIDMNGERKRGETYLDNPSAEPATSTDDSSHVPQTRDTMVITPEPVQVGDAVFADVHATERDNQYRHLFTGEDVIANELKGKVLYRNELPPEFFAQNSGLDAKLYQITEVTIRRVTDDPSSDRRVVRYTARELMNIF